MQVVPGTMRVRPCPAKALPAPRTNGNPSAGPATPLRLGPGCFRRQPRRDDRLPLGDAHHRYPPCSAQKHARSLTVHCPRCRLGLDHCDVPRLLSSGRRRLRRTSSFAGSNAPAEKGATVWMIFQLPLRDFTQRIGTMTSETQLVPASARRHPVATRPRPQWGSAAFTRNSTQTHAALGAGRWKESTRRKRVT